MRGNLRTEFPHGDLNVSGDGRLEHRVNDHVAVSEHVRVENGEARRTRRSVQRPATRRISQWNTVLKEMEVYVAIFAEAKPVRAST